jgi:DNA-binding CsgD family transcriptional regulator
MVEHEQLPMPIERARTLLAKGSLHRRRKQKAAAKQFLQEALEIFDGAGAKLWAERARVELRRVGIRPSAPLALTPTEQQVAELAAVGRRTKEIAQDLFMSPKTVESVITRIYRKLGTTSRAELATLLGSRGTH